MLKIDCFDEFLDQLCEIFKTDKGKLPCYHKSDLEQLYSGQLYTQIEEANLDYDSGFEDGKDEGYEDGYEDGVNDGFDNGVDEANEIWYDILRKIQNTLDDEKAWNNLLAKSDLDKKVLRQLEAEFIYDSKEVE